MSRRNLIIESSAVTLLLLSAVLVLHLDPPLGPARDLIIPLYCLAVPWLILRARREARGEFGYLPEKVGPSLMTGLAVSAALLVPYFLLYAFWFGGPRLPTPVWQGAFRWVKMSVFQVFYVSIPEEFFFRGYLQTRFNQIFGTPRVWLGARAGWGLPAAALIFTLFHMIFAVNVWTVGVLVPALIFGWLREKTESIAAPTVFHALSNIVLFTFQGRY